mgnify:CR=1 FL=1
MIDYDLIELMLEIMNYMFERDKKKKIYINKRHKI